MIKPEFWSSETLMRVSRDARLTFIGLWNFCDDYGFCINSIRRIIGDIYPYDESVTEAKAKQWINELIEHKLMIPVDYNSKHLLFVKGWGEHQTVQHKSKRAHIEPADLEEVIKGSLKSHESLIQVYLESHAPKRKKKEKEESNKEERNIIPPKIEWVIKYCNENKFSTDPQGFMDWNESKGKWSTMKDWQATIRTWERRNSTQQGQEQELSLMERMEKRR